MYILYLTFSVSWTVAIVLSILGAVAILAIVVCLCYCLKNKNKKKQHAFGLKRNYFKVCKAINSRAEVSDNATLNTHRIVFVRPGIRRLYPIPQRDITWKRVLVLQASRALPAVPLYLVIHWLLITERLWVMGWPSPLQWLRRMNILNESPCWPK